VMFTLYSAFKENQHFNVDNESNMYQAWWFIVGMILNQLIVSSCSYHLILSINLSKIKRKFWIELFNLKKL
jgi:hypothetical protein